MGFRVYLSFGWATNRILYALLSFVVAYAPQALAATEVLRLEVVDAKGRPAPNTVVILPSQSEIKPTEIAQSHYAIDQIDLEFRPHVSLVPTGQPVFFPNSDRTRHHVYSFSEPNNFELKLYREKDAPPVQFQTEGVVELGCNIHDSMKGYIYVSNASVQAVADGEGVVSLALTGPVAKGTNILVWHPLMGAKGAASYPLDGAVNTVLKLAISLPDDPTAKPSSLKERLQQFKKTHD